MSNLEELNKLFLQLVREAGKARDWFENNTIGKYNSPHEDLLIARELNRILYKIDKLK